MVKRIAVGLVGLAMLTSPIPFGFIAGGVDGLRVGIACTLVVPVVGVVLATAWLIGELLIGDTLANR